MSVKSDQMAYLDFLRANGDRQIRHQFKDGKGGFCAVEAIRQLKNEKQVDLNLNLFLPRIKAVQRRIELDLFGIATMNDEGELTFDEIAEQVECFGHLYFRR